MPPGTLHQRVTAALANWQLDDAEALLVDLADDPSPDAPAPDRASSDAAAAPTPLSSLPSSSLPPLARAWADTLRAELLVRRLRLAGHSLLGAPLTAGDPVAAVDLLDLPVGLGPTGDPTDDPADPGALDQPQEDDGGAASHAALVATLVRSARAAFDAAEDDLQRAAGLARHARIELLGQRIDAAMDEAVEAASLLDPRHAPSPLLVHTLGTLAAVLADLELMPLALDFQRRAHDAAEALAALPAVPERRATDRDREPEPDPAVLWGEVAARLGELHAELGEGLLDDGVPEAAQPHFTDARRLAERALELLPPGSPVVVAAQVVHGWALVGLGEQAAAVGPLRGAARTAAVTGDRALTASAQLALGRALRRQGDALAADEHLAEALALATAHGLPRLRRAALRELCTLHAELDDAGRALPYLQAYLSDELDRVDERRTRWVELFSRRKSLLETERAAGQLRRQAYEDTLTHLPNRRYAEATLDALLSAGSAPALAVVDVDRFKAINDSIGHPGGDAVLRAVAERLQAGCRDTDEVCRWAGDEFVVLLPDTTAEQAERALERIRRSVAEHDWASLGLDTPVTISVGIASAARGDDRRTLFAAADGVLYDAKRGGRDRVVRLSAVTHSRTGDDPLDALFGPPPAAPAITVGDVPLTRPADAPTAGTVPAAAASAEAVPAGAVAAGFDLLLGDAAPPVASGTPVRLGGGLGGDPGSGPVGGPGGDATAEPVPVAEPDAGPEPDVEPGPDGEPGPGPVAEPVLEPLAEHVLQPVADPVAREVALPAPEVVWGAGRTTDQVLALVRESRHQHPDRPAVVLRAGADTLVALASEHDAYTSVDAAAMAAAVGPLPEPRGRVAVLCAHAADTPVAAEAAFVARISGVEVVRVDDVSATHLSPVLAERDLLADVECLVVVAGLDASLAGVISAATDLPVVAVPTSTGQPPGFGGIGALMTMVNSTAPGVVVSPIDNGYAAGVFAARLARRTAR